VTRTTWERIVLALIVALYFGLAIAYNVRTPAWQAPDEPAHYNYIAQVSANGCCPVIEQGDWDSAYLAQLTSSRFAAGTLDALADVQYEDHQPPLYYVLASVMFRLTNGNLSALRLFSTLLGAIVVLLTFMFAKTLYPRRSPVALGAAALVAFVPQHLAILSSVNNDALAEVVIAAALVAAAQLMRGARVPVWAVGVIAGIGLLTKLNTVVLLGVIPVGLVLNGAFSRGKITSRRVARDVIVFLIPALLIGAVWMARNISVYGFPDIFGLGAHDAVVSDQPRTAELIAREGFDGYVRRALETTFVSFWGQFGWMALPLSGWMIALILILIGVSALGWVVGMIPAPSPPGVSAAPPAPDSARQAIWGMLIALMIAALAQYIYYNLEFWQHQGRYLYPALIPLALITALGLDGWGQLLAGYDKHSSFRWWAQAPVLVLVALNVFVVWRVIPSLAP